MSFPSADVLQLAGRILIAAYFVAAGLFNIATWQKNLDEFERQGLPGGRFLLPSGIALQSIGALLFIHTPTIAIGAAMLGLFTLAADIMFHRFWRYDDPRERQAHMLFLMEHLALYGALIGLAAD